MAKKRIASDQPQDDFFANLAKDCGGELLEDSGKDGGFIDTGVLAINFIMSGRFVGGGMPCRTLTEIYGESSSGKSLLATNVLRGVQKLGGVAVYLDAERAIHRDFAVRVSKVNAKEFVVLYPDTVKNAFYKIASIITRIRTNPAYDGKPICIVYDSVTVSPTDDEFAETTVDMENATAGEKEKAGVKKEQPGARARQISRELRKLMPLVKEHNASVLFVNQLRNRIGVLYGSPLAPASGEALKYYCSTRLSLTSNKKILDGNKKVIGVLTGFTNTKSRYCHPHQKAHNVSLMFDSGIDPFGGLLDILIQEGRVSGTAGNYIVLEPWAGGKEIKFKAAKERNTVPAEVLMQCPALVDANDASEIEYYVQLYAGAINAAFNDNFVQEEIQPDEDN